MTARITTITAAAWLCLLPLAACDDPDVALAEDAAVLDAEPDERIIAEDELRDLCELAEEQAEAPPIGPGDLTDEPHPTKGDCIEGYWDFDTVDESCGTCWHDAIKKSGSKRVTYKRWCYTSPSPATCGCDPFWAHSWYCQNDC